MDGWAGLLVAGWSDGRVEGWSGRRMARSCDGRVVRGRGHVRGGVVNHYPLYNNGIMGAYGNCHYRGGVTRRPDYILGVGNVVNGHGVDSRRVTRLLRHHFVLLSNFTSGRKGTFPSILRLTSGNTVGVRSIVNGYPRYNNSVHMNAHTFGYSGCDGRRTPYGFTV